MKKFAAIFGIFLLALSTINPAFASLGYGEATVHPSYRVTYSASTPGFSPASSATDVFQIYGSSSKTVRILRVEIGGVNSTQLAAQVAFLLRRSTANSGAGSTTVTSCALDQNDSSASAVVKYWTSNPTTGTLVAQHTAKIVATSLTGASSQPFVPNIVLFDWQLAGKAITLNGTSDGLVINFNGVTLTNSPTLYCNVIWTEE